MKKLVYVFIATILIVACGETKKGPVEQQMFSNDEDMPDDSTMYGYCLAGSDSTCLRMLAGNKDTITVLINGEDFDEPTMVAGGFLLGDRMAVTTRKIEAGLVAQRVINLTTLLGHWKSVDKDFEILENGEINSMLSEESHRWTNWRILNGQLLLSKDTFDLVSLNVDSMCVENKVGLYCYYRVRKDTTHAAEIDRARQEAAARRAARAKAAAAAKDTVK